MSRMFQNASFCATESCSSVVAGALLCMHHTNLSRTEFVACYQTNSDLQGRCRALTVAADC